MKSLTIHKLETDLAKAIEQLSASTGLSQNKVIKQLLRKALGLKPNESPKRDLSGIFGVWTDQEENTFNESIEPFNEIDNELWK